MKSRRAASSSGEEKVTASGRRPSEYAPSLRNVATCTLRCVPGPTLGPITSTTPNAAPTATVRRNRVLDFAAGVADGGHVVVGGGQAEQFVPDAAAGEQGDVPGGLEPGDDIGGELAVGHGRSWFVARHALARAGDAFGSR